MRILVAVPEQPLEEPNAVQVLATCLAIQRGVMQYERWCSFVLSHPPFHMMMQCIALECMQTPIRRHIRAVDCCSGV